MKVEKERIKTHKQTKSKSQKQARVGLHCPEGMRERTISKRRGERRKRGEGGEIPTDPGVPLTLSFTFPFSVLLLHPFSLSFPLSPACSPVIPLLPLSLFSARVSYLLWMGNTARWTDRGQGRLLEKNKGTMRYLSCPCSRVPGGKRGAWETAERFW